MINNSDAIKNNVVKWVKFSSYEELENKGYHIPKIWRQQLNVIFESIKTYGTSLPFIDSSNNGIYVITNRGQKLIGFANKL